MRIEVVDPGGHAIGLAIGLVELGHDVFYRGAERRAPAAGEIAQMRRELIGRFFGAQGDDAGERDLLVLVDTFADYINALENGYCFGGKAPIRHPLQDDAGVLIYPHRLGYLLERASAHERVVVVDTSDLHAPREVAFEMQPHVQLFAREAGVGERWRPFPYLYNTAMLWLEYVCERSMWLTPSRDRRPCWDWVFCGTIDHSRYGGARLAALEEVAAQWPQADGLVRAGVSFSAVVGTLQRARSGLDLPGAGELCFRLHECLALGVPVWRPFGRRLPLPDALRSVVVRESRELPDATAEQVREVYRQHYAPAAAAGYLLTKAYFQTSPATNIAMAAST